MSQVAAKWHRLRVSLSRFFVAETITGFRHALTHLDRQHPHSQLPAPLHADQQAPPGIHTRRVLD